MEYNKPPLGAKPYYITAICRIAELSKAIHSFYDYSQELDRINYIKKWASEIILQCELIERMQEVEKGNDHDSIFSNG